MMTNVQKKKPGRKRTKLSKNQVILENLPKGFRFIGPPYLCTEENVMQQLKENALLEK